MDRNQTAKYILIGALVFVFGYFGIEKFTRPDFWIDWMPVWIDGALGMDKYTWLSVFGVLEIATALGLLIPIRRLQQLAAVGMIVQLLGILTQTGWGDVAVRDVSILISAIALFLLL